MAFPATPPITKVTYYCSKPSLQRNFPKEKVEEIARQLIKLLPPKPIDPKVPGDVDRFKSENQRYEHRRDVLLQVKSTCDDLAVCVEHSLNPAKSKKAAQLYQQMHKNSPEAQALQAKLRAARKEMALELNLKYETPPLCRTRESGLSFPS